MAQTPDVIRFGHLTPRTGFLGPLGEYAVMAADLAVEEINAAGGVLGRRLEILKEDSVNPQTASTKAERMVERDKVAAIIGEISSAACLTIAQVAQRTRTLYINTGGNSDALRGSNCNKYMFHVESQNSMYVKTCGRSLMAQGLVQGKKWFSLTADYAFGHDLLKVAKRFMEGAGGQFVADKLVPTDLTDFSAMLLEIRNARPDLVVANLAATRSRTSSSSTRSSACSSRSPASASIRRSRGGRQGELHRTWPVVWHHLIDKPNTKKFVQAFTAKYRKPPENQAWGDYLAVKIFAQTMNELKSTDSAKMIEHWEKGAKFDVMKTREGYFRARDHQ